MDWSPGLSVGIPTYNGAHRVEMLLKNIRQRMPKDLNYELIVCDDSGKPEHQAKVHEICKTYGACFIANERNSGVAASWNRLTRFSIRECMVILNDDVLLADDALGYLYYAVMANPKIGSFGLNFRFITAGDEAAIMASPTGKIIPLNVRYEGKELIRHERFATMPPEEDGQPGRVMCPTGPGFGFRRAMYEAAGGFDPRYFAFYEETDFGVSCAKLGFPSCTLAYPTDNYHVWSATFGSAPEIPASKIMMESKRKFVEKWSKILGVSFNDAPEIHNLIMDKIPPIEVQWLGLGKKERSATV